MSHISIGGGDPLKDGGTIMHIPSRHSCSKTPSVSSSTGRRGNPRGGGGENSPAASPSPSNQKNGDSIGAPPGVSDPEGKKPTGRERSNTYAPPNLYHVIRPSKRRWRRRCSRFMMSALARARRGQAPTEVVKGLVGPALQILGDKSTPLKDRQEKLRQLVSADVFDYTAMTRSAMGIHWRDISNQQRQDVTQVFTAFLRDSYISRIAGFLGPAGKVTTSAKPTSAMARTEVKTTIEQGGGKSPVAGRLFACASANGKWLIYDIAIDNISIAANYRNQFNRVINNQGFDTLLSRPQDEAARPRGSTRHGARARLNVPWFTNVLSVT